MQVSDTSKSASLLYTIVGVGVEFNAPLYTIINKQYHFITSSDRFPVPVRSSVKSKSHARKRKHTTKIPCFSQLCRGTGLQLLEFCCDSTILFVNVTEMVRVLHKTLICRCVFAYCFAYYTLLCVIAHISAVWRKMYLSRGKQLLQMSLNRPDNAPRHSARQKFVNSRLRNYDISTDKVNKWLQDCVIKGTGEFSPSESVDDAPNSEPNVKTVTRAVSGDGGLPLSKSAVEVSIQNQNVDSDSRCWC